MSPAERESLACALLLTGVYVWEIVWLFLRVDLRPKCCEWYSQPIAYPIAALAGLAFALLCFFVVFIRRHGGKEKIFSCMSCKCCSRMGFCICQVFSCKFWRSVWNCDSKMLRKGLEVLNHALLFLPFLGLVVVDMGMTITATSDLHRKGLQIGIDVSLYLALMLGWYVVYREPSAWQKRCSMLCVFMHLALTIILIILVAESDDRQHAAWFHAAAILEEVSLFEILHFIIEQAQHDHDDTLAVSAVRDVEKGKIDIPKPLKNNFTDVNIAESAT